MWHFGKYGFTSAVAYDATKDRNTKSKFREIVLGEEGLAAVKTPAKDRTDAQKALLKKAAGTHILVRARVKEDLEDLKRVCKSLHIETDSSADYAYRAVITRDLFKKFLALHVDDIDYDSHFKEVVRDNSPKAQGRYSAMMGIWSEMAKLQPISPWSGSWGSYGGSGYTGSGSGGSYVSPFGSDAKGVSVTGGSDDAAEDVNDFIEKYVNSGGTLDYTQGRGPKTGFKKDDRVTGYSGGGVVTAVEERAGKPDMVTVKLDPKGNDKKGRIAKFVSNYLMPENLPDITDEPERMVEVDEMYAALLSAGNLAMTEIDLKDCDDDAFELLTRLQELHGEGAYVSKDQVDDVYDEILWENEDEAGKIKWVSDGVPIPSKYAHEEQQWINKTLLAEDAAEAAKK